jgi:hypothetical protein
MKIPKARRKKRRAMVSRGMETASGSVEVSKSGLAVIFRIFQTIRTHGLFGIFYGNVLNNTGIAAPICACLPTKLRLCFKIRAHCQLD